MAWGRPGGVADTPSDEEEDEAGKGIPLPSMRSRREARRGVGVWSPFGQVFNPHGVVELSLGRKPQPATIVHPPASDGAGGAKKFTAANASSHVFKDSSVTTLPPVFKRGLGLGLGLQPQRFPRALLKSSEGRLVSCHAGRDHGLASSSSEPTLPNRAQIEGQSAADTDAPEGEGSLQGTMDDSAQQPPSHRRADRRYTARDTWSTGA